MSRKEDLHGPDPRPKAARWKDEWVSPSDWSGASGSREVLELSSAEPPVAHGPG